MDQSRSDRRDPEGTLHTDLPSPNDPVDQSLIFGRNPVIAALQAHRSINKLLIAKGASGQEISAIIDLARSSGVVYQFVDRRRLDTLTHGTHQGVVAIGAEHGYVDYDELLSTAHRRGEHPFLVMLDGIQDPHNLGSIIRSADVAGAHGVIIPRRHAVGITSVVVKASAGAVEYVPVARVPNLNQTMQNLKSSGLWCIGLEVDGNESFERVDYTGPVVIVVGGEGTGLRPLVRRECDMVVRLPIRGHTGSMNASVAAAILMYEVFRQRSGAQKG